VGKRIKVGIVILLSVITLLAGGCTRELAEEAKEIPSKKEITLALTMPNTALNKVIADFNAANEEYCVKVVLPEGAESFDLSDDMFGKWEDFRKQIQMELSAGKGPDLMGDDMMQNPEDYAVQGYLECLERERFQEEALLPAVLQNGMIDEKLYGVPYDFTLSFAAYGQSPMEGLGSLTMEELMKQVQQSEVLALQKGMDGKAIVLRYALWDDSNTDYIDWENKVSHLAEEPFLQVLEFAKEYADDGKGKASDQYFAVGYADIPMSMLREIKDLYDKLEGHVFMAGYPRKVGVGSYATARMLYVNSQSENKEGAVAFLNYLVSAQAQTKYATHDFLKEASNSGGFYAVSPPHFPVNKAALEALVEHEKEQDKKNGYMKEDGTFVYVIPPYTEEQLEAFWYLVENAEPAESNVMAVTSIVYEELEGYFSGDISAEQAATKLHNRIQLYLDE